MKQQRVKSYQLIEETRQATHYYLIPQHNTLIPKCAHSQRVLITLLSQAHDVHSPTYITEYPLVKQEYARLFTTWLILTVKVVYQKFIDYTPQPVKALPVVLNLNFRKEMVQDPSI